jgi:hypothetical protein
MYRDWKVVQCPGSFAYPAPRRDGTVTNRLLHFSPDKIRAYDRTVRSMLADGIKIPIIPEHSIHGVPLTPQEYEKKVLADTVGFITDSRVNAKNELELLHEVVDPEWETKIGTTVLDCSPGFRDWYRTGDGKKWTDVVAHVALTNHPVDHHKPKFRPMTTTDAYRGNHVTCMSLCQPVSDVQLVPLWEVPYPVARTCLVRTGTSWVFRHADGKQRFGTYRAGTTWLRQQYSKQFSTAPADVVWMAVLRAPVGGVSVQGRFYRGGQFIPSEVMANATPEEKQKIEQHRTDYETKRASDAKGHMQDAESVHDAILRHAGNHAHKEQSTKDKQHTLRRWKALQNEHGSKVLERVVALAGTEARKMAELGPDGVDKPEGQHLQRRLAAYAQMVGFALNPASVGEYKASLKGGRPLLEQMEAKAKGEEAKPYAPQEQKKVTEIAEAPKRAMRPTGKPIPNGHAFNPDDPAESQAEDETRAAEDREENEPPGQHRTALVPAEQPRGVTPEDPIIGEDGLFYDRDQIHTDAQGTVWAPVPPEGARSPATGGHYAGGQGKWMPVVRNWMRDKMVQKWKATQNAGASPEAPKLLESDHAEPQTEPVPAAAPVVHPDEPVGVVPGEGSRGAGEGIGGGEPRGAAEVLPDEEEPGRRRAGESLKAHLTRIGLGDAHEHVKAHAADLLRMATEEVEKHNAVYQDAMQRLRKGSGLTESQFYKKFRDAKNGGDHASVPGFDAVTRSIASEHPDHFRSPYADADAQSFGDDYDNREKLWNILTEGPRKRPGLAEFERQAVEDAQYHHAKQYAPSADNAEEGDADFSPEELEEHLPGAGLTPKHAGETIKRLKEGRHAEEGLQSESGAGEHAAPDAGGARAQEGAGDRPPPGEQERQGQAEKVAESNKANTEQAKSTPEGGYLGGRPFRVGAAVTLPAGHRIGMGKLKEPMTGVIEAKDLDEDGVDIHRVRLSNGRSTWVTHDDLYHAGNQSASPRATASDDDFMQPSKPGPHSADAIDSYAGQSFTSDQGHTLDVKKADDGTWSVGTKTGLSKAAAANHLNSIGAVKAKGLFAPEVTAQAPVQKTPEKLEFPAASKPKEAPELPGMKDTFAPGMFGKAKTEGQSPYAQKVDELPPIPEGHGRVTHVTTKQGIAPILQHGLDYSRQGLESTTDVFLKNDDIHHLSKTGKVAGTNFDRNRFGDHVVLSDLSEDEYRKHADLTGRAPGKIHPSRIVGHLDRTTGKFTANPQYDPHARVDLSPATVAHSPSGPRARRPGSGDTNMSITRSHPVYSPSPLSVALGLHV